VGCQTDKEEHATFASVVDDPSKEPVQRHRCCGHRMPQRSHCILVCGLVLADDCRICSIVSFPLMSATHLA
jgi:hypothetical protein